MGEARQFVTEGNALYATFALALAIIFLVLAIQFESVRPAGHHGVGAAGHQWRADRPGVGMATMNIYSQVGLITLVGLITKHGILICEVAKEEQLLHGLNRMQAVMQAAKVRLRPILMTTAAMIAGLIPLLYASGGGGTALQHRHRHRGGSGHRHPVHPVRAAGHLHLPGIRHKPLPEFDESIRQKPRAVTDPSSHKKAPKGALFLSIG